MKTIGIIGGLSPESTLSYYKQINDLVRERLGGHHSAKILLMSADFGEFCDLKEKGDWQTQAKLLCDYAMALEKAGADFLILATNTMHKMADDITAVINIPFLHIADATAEVALANNFKCVGFIGTKYSMELDFYTGRLKRKNIEALIPEEQSDRDIINDIIYNKLTKGIVDADSEKEYVRIIDGLKSRGAQAIILGCTEIAMLINPSNSPLPVLDTTRIHVEEAVKFSLA